MFFRHHLKASARSSKRDPIKGGESQGYLPETITQ
jgi:hypothetical protein